MTYYDEALSRIHHEAFGDYAAAAAPGVLRILGEPCDVVELGAGSGALTVHLIEAGHRVIATDASPAMIELARSVVPEAEPRILVLPDDPIPTSDAVVSVGHAFSYLANTEEIERGLRNAMNALRPGGVLAIDILDIAYGAVRKEPVTLEFEGEGWTLIARQRLNGPNTFVRDMTIEIEGAITDEVHQNTLVDVDTLVERLTDDHFDVAARNSFGTEALPEGLRVIYVRRSLRG